MMVSNNEEKYFSRVCMKVRSVELSLLAAAYKSLSIPKIKRLKDVQHINLCNNLYKTTLRRITAKKCSSLLTIPNTVVVRGRVYISFHVDIENGILCHEPGMSAVIFSSS